MTINGIITRLPSFFETEILNLWDDLHRLFGISRIKTTSFPHLTWVIAKHADESLVEQHLNTFRKNIRPLVFSTNGIGVFTGKRPAIYIQIKPSIQLLTFQCQLCDLFSNHSVGLKKFYTPDRWIPHISVAIEDIDSSNIGKVMTYLLSKSFKQDIRLENVTFVRKEIGKNMEIIKDYWFSAG